MPTLAKLAEAAAHPGEVVPLVKMALAARRARALPQSEDLAFCYGMLNRVSRRCEDGWMEGCGRRVAGCLLVCGGECVVKGGRARTKRSVAGDSRPRERARPGR